LSRRALATLGLGTAALGLVAGRVVIDSAAALRAGDQALAQADARGAVVHYREAAHLYAPGSPYPREALDRLGGIAAQAEGDGDLDLARLALEAARGSLLGTRSLYTPFADRLPPIEKRLAAIYAGLEGRTGRTIGGARPDPERIAFYLDRLGRHPGPHPGFALLALIGLATWIAAAVGFITRGLDAGLRLRRRAAIACGVGFSVGFALFLVGLRLA